MSNTKLQLKVLLTIIVLQVIVVFGAWYAMWSQVPAASRSWFYQTSYMQDVKEKDEFGDEATTRKQVTQFTPGLIDMALPTALGVNAIPVLSTLAWLLHASLKTRKAA